MALTDAIKFTPSHDLFLSDQSCDSADWSIPHPHSDDAENLACAESAPVQPVDDAIGDIGGWNLEVSDANELDSICDAIQDDLGIYLLCVGHHFSWRDRFQSFRGHLILLID